MRRIFEIMVTLDFIYRLVLYSHETVSFNIIFLNVLERIIQFHLSMWFRKKRLETTFKGDNVKSLIKTSNCENLVLYFSKTIQKIAAFAMLFLVSVTKHSLKNVLASPNDQKYQRYLLALKINVTLAWPLRFVIPYFLNGNSCQMFNACIVMTTNETYVLMWMGSAMQNNC